MRTTLELHILICVSRGIDYPYAVAKYISEKTGKYQADSSVSHAMRRMKTSGLLNSRKDGRQTIYSLSEDGVNTLNEIKKIFSIEFRQK